MLYSKIFFLFFFFSFIFISWRLIMLQYCKWVLSYIDMNQPWIYMYSTSQSPLPPPSLPNPSGSSQCTRPEHLSHASRDMCTPTFIATLFIIARTWKQPSCPSADEWIKKLWHIYTMEYYSAIKKNSFESVLMRWMKLEPIIPRF